MTDDRRGIMQRRSFIASLSAVAAVRTAGCGPHLNGNAPTLPLADVHCHIFNASDLPAEKFIKIVFLGLYPKQHAPDAHRLLDTNDEDVVDWLINLFLAILGEGGAPTARDEIEILSGAKPPIASSTNSPAAEEFTIQRTAEFLRKVEAPAQLSMRGHSTSERGARIIQGALRRAGRAEGIAPLGTVDANSSEVIARNAYFSEYDIGVYLRWFETTSGFVCNCDRMSA